MFDFLKFENDMLRILAFTLLGVLEDSWTFGLVSYLEDILSFNYFKYFFYFFLSSFSYSHYVSVIAFLVVP